MYYFLYQTRHHEHMSMEMYTPFIIPHFYVVWGNLLFLFLLQNIDCGYSFQRVPTLYFLSKNKEILKEIQLKKKLNFYDWKNMCITWACFHVRSCSIFFSHMADKQLGFYHPSGTAHNMAVQFCTATTKLNFFCSNNPTVSTDIRSTNITTIVRNFNWHGTAKIRSCHDFIFLWMIWWKYRSTTRIRIFTN